MVPTFTCGFVRSNFFFAIAPLSPSVSPPRGSNPRPRPYQGRALPTELGGQSSLFPDIKRELLCATPSSAGSMKIIRRGLEKGKESAENGDYSVSARAFNVVPCAGVR